MEVQKKTTPAVFNVKEFGAVGNGKTDDTAAFQAALDAARPHEGMVTVPAGQYCIRSVRVYERRCAARGCTGQKTAALPCFIAGTERTRAALIFRMPTAA